MALQFVCFIIKVVSLVRTFHLHSPRRFLPTGKYQSPRYYYLDAELAAPWHHANTDHHRNIFTNLKLPIPYHIMWMLDRHSTRDRCHARISLLLYSYGKSQNTSLGHLTLSNACNLYLSTCPKTQLQSYIYFFVSYKAGRIVFYVK